MPFLWKPYTSDVTQMIQELKAKLDAVRADIVAGKIKVNDAMADPAACKR